MLSDVDESWYLLRYINKCGQMMINVEKNLWILMAGDEPWRILMNDKLLVN